eukprot:CAMPEP_0176486914 /NCGR_PEP_ID=MMETSP0200_2-20121128/5832_1 /TAXON_ID=947934 /ORGANISM="Chaetoceros sp., Strain GSL56" /LENGTH=571 /DNA_ID=CAMNT_0017883667 /DNA_START=177 /DNA_END=1892 /DNA_ORIENTATION=+
MIHQEEACENDLKQRKIINGKSINTAQKDKRTHRYFVCDIKCKKKRCREALGAIILYIMCISLPSLFGILVRWYEYNFVIAATTADGVSNIDWASTTTTTTGKKEQSSLLFQFQQAATTGTGYYNHNLWGDDLSFATLTRHFRRCWKVLSSVCRFLERHIGQYMKRDALSDVQFVIAISTLLSVLRVFLVYMLVPRYLAPRRLAALFHAKSTHLLSSSEYRFSNNNNNNNNRGSSTNRERGKGVEQNNDSFAIFRLLSNLWTKMSRSFQRSLGHEAAQYPYDYDNLDVVSSARLFMAPRYATAVFRLLFCFLSCSWALVKFSSSNFWPVWVGGRFMARTKYCWDLSGSVAIQGAALDSDFDHQNSALRYFFLGQASYQIHSLSFHFFSMVLLLVCGRGNDGRHYLSARTSLKSYFRPVMEHSFYFVLTVMTYMFSGLRRLGAICIFVLEFSSMVLQLLQLCINAPEQSRLKNMTLIQFVHRFLAIPVFIYCRFFVLPFIVQYSAWFESTMWLKQIEHALAPGVAMVIYIFFNGMLLLAFGFNLVYLRRLLFHPSLAQVSNTQQTVVTKKED